MMRILLLLLYSVLIFHLGIGIAKEGDKSTTIPPSLYKKPSKSRRIEGWVKVKFTITETGTVKNAKVIESQPDSIFDHAALKTIARVKFQPKTIDGKAVEQLVIRKLKFTLPEE